MRVEVDIEQTTMLVLLVGYDRYGTESRGKWLESVGEALGPSSIAGSDLLSHLALSGLEAGH